MTEVVTAIQNLAQDVNNNIPTVLGIALGFFGTIFGVRFLLRLIKSASR
jgi:hypothetical protein